MRIKLAPIAGHGAAAFVVLAAGVVLAAAAAYFVASQVERAAKLKFDNAAADARDAIESRIRAYSEVLVGARGLFIASDTVTREAFRGYIDSLTLNHRYPGIQVIHYSHRVSAAQRPAFEALVRNDRSVDPRGYPDFAINPPGERPEYVIVQYVEPMAGNEIALGLDLGGDPVRLAALARTRDSGQLTASGTIALAHDPRRHPGFAMRLPVYRKGMPLATVAQRREAFVGMVSTSFIVIDLMRGVLSKQFLERIHVRIHDAGFLDAPGGLRAPDPGNLMFDSDRLLKPVPPQDAASRAQPAYLTSTADLDVGGRRWNLYFNARQGFMEPTERWLPWATLLGGFTITLLLFGLIRSLATSGSRAVELADRITEDLRQSQAQRNLDEERYRVMFENAAVGITRVDLDGVLVDVNQKFCDMLGHARGELIGKSIKDITHPDDYGQGVAFRSQVTRGEIKSAIGEKRFVRKDGAIIWARRTMSVARDGAGNPQYVISVVEDITEHKQAAKALGESESRYRSVIASIAEGVILRDKNARIVACNASAERILGRSLDQMRGNVYFDPDWQAIRDDGSAFPNDDRPANAALRTGQPQPGVVIGLRKQDGTVLWLTMSAQPLFEESDTAPSGVVTTITDITQRKQAELRQAMEHVVTRLLSEAEALEKIMPKIIQTICETLGFACGVYWLWDEHRQAGVRAGTWSVPSAEIMEFVALSRWSEHPQQTTGGLHRRARASGEPVWITDVTQDASFRRGPLAAKAGLHSAFAFPVRFGNDILGVMEFFGRASRPPDEVLVQSTRSIGSQIGQFMARRQAEERVRHLAHYDELTGLPNRSMFNQRLSHALAQARRHEKPLAILFIDLDRFKNINDTLGHEAGDRVLKDVADCLRGCLRESDTVGRLGGDEFVVLIEGLPQAVDVAAVAQKILTAIAKPFILDSQEFHITASIGISTYPDDSEDMQTLLKNADISMYRAKEQGKNNYQFYSAQINVHSLERLALESSLRRALERNEFLLHYQPRLNIGSGRITGVEALVRWQQPAKALIPPAQFIPLAEETGLIVPIGEWVLKTACAQNKAWQEQGLPPLRIAVNLSARQFTHENLLQDVARVLSETGLDPTSLEFEITESMVMHNPEHAVKLLNRLKAMGISLSIDDFGTGYSSLNYLKRFPIDSVKIDRSFIQDLPGDSDDAAITQAIIAMAHSLRLKVVAEGVETEEQLGFLRRHGCDEMQGYYFSRPVPMDELLRLLHDTVAATASAAKSLR